MAVLVSKGLEVNTIPKLGFLLERIGVVLAYPDSIKVSRIFNKASFLFKDLNFFLKYSLSIMSDFIIFP